jgi:hypothetical protein
MTECPICYDGVADYKTQCNHEFHKICLTNWYNTHRTCPMCRVLILNPEGQVFQVSREFLRTVEEVNEIQRQQGTRFVIDKISEPFDGNKYTTIFFINIIDQNPDITLHFRRKFPEIIEYNNVLHSANGYPQIIVRYSY